MKFLFLIILIAGCSSPEIEQKKKVAEYCSNHNKTWSFDNYSKKSDYCNLLKQFQKTRDLHRRKEARRKMNLIQSRRVNTSL